MYAEYYGLRAEPFLLTPDSRFYFDSSVHAQAMAHLQYGLQRGEGFIVITGEVGAGKTTIVQHLCNTVDETRVAPAHIVTTLLNGPELIRMVCSAFGIADIPQAKDAALLRLKAHLEELNNLKRWPLIIVDEAQNLSKSALEELRMLSNFQVGNRSACQIFLVGQPQFRDKLSDPDLEQLRQRIIAAYHLGPLRSEDCVKYLFHRLKLVDWKNDPEFSQDALEAIYNHTAGVPRRINTLCSRLLLYGFLDEIHTFTAKEVDQIAADLQAETGHIGGRKIAHVPRPYLSEDVPADSGTRLAVIESRMDQHESSLRHIHNSLARMIDPNLLGK